MESGFFAKKKAAGAYASAVICIMRLDTESDQRDFFAGFFAEELLQLGDFGKGLGIIVQLCILDGAVCDQGNVLAGLGSQLLFQGND